MSEQTLPITICSAFYIECRLCHWWSVVGRAVDVGDCVQCNRCGQTFSVQERESEVETLV